MMALFCYGFGAKTNVLVRQKKNNNQMKGGEGI